MDELATFKPLDVSAELRAKDPFFAVMCDNFNSAMASFHTLRVVNAALEAELATLRAQVSARAAA